MLKAVPISWCSWTFQIEDERHNVAKIDMAWLRESANLRIGGDTYRAAKCSAFGGTFELTHDGTVVASAGKRMMIRTFDVAAGDRHFELSALSIFGRSFGLYEHGQLIGTMGPTGIWSRKARVDFPDDVSNEVQVFLIWLVLILWRRSASSNAAAG